MSMLVMLTLTACEKDNTTLLTDGVWTFQNITTDSEDETIINLIALGKALLTDATMEFQEGGTYILTSPLIEDPSTGEWELIGDDQLILDPDDEASHPQSRKHPCPLGSNCQRHPQKQQDGANIHGMTNSCVHS